MAKIRVIAGGCGVVYTDENGNRRHALKTAEHGAFECDDAQAAHFVDKGVAEYVGKAPATQAGDPDNLPALGHLDAAELEKWDYNDLKKLAADMGVKPEGQKKADYIAAITAAEVEAGEELDAEDPDDLPVLDAADPE